LAGTVYDRLARLRQHVTMSGYIRALGGRCEDLNIPQKVRCPLPDHEDEHPSARVFPDSDVVHCFACGFHGDIIDLHMRIYECNILEALTAIEEAFALEQHPFPHTHNEPMMDLRVEKENALLDLWKRVNVRFAGDDYLRDMNYKLADMWIEAWDSDNWNVMLSVIRNVLLSFAETKGLLLEAQI